MIYSKDLSSFNLPLPVAVAPISNIEAFLARERMAFNCEKETQKVRERLPLLNTNQRAFFDSVVAALNDKEKDRLFCLDAPGGTGKTFVLNCLMNAVRADGHIVVATALSAVASMLLEGGTTLHSKLKVVIVSSILLLSSNLPQVPIEVTADTYCNFTDACGTGKLLQEACLLIIDEVSMGHRHIYEAIDRLDKKIYLFILADSDSDLSRSLQRVRGNDKLFGGLCVVFSGDWRQTLPIVQGGSEAQIINACLKYSPIWRSVAVHHLVENMRVRLSGSTEVEQHSKWLLKVSLNLRVGLL